MKRTAGWLAAGLTASALLALVLLRAWAYVPVNVWQQDDFTDPAVLSPAQAYHFAVDAARAFGGIPPDARLDIAGGVGMRPLGGSPHRMTFYFLWHPRENGREFAGINDMAMAQVVSVPVVTCVRAGCSNYVVTYHPELQSFMRKWHPAWRAWLQYRIRRSASVLASLSRMRTSCPGGVDEAALRRVIGSAHEYLEYGGMRYPVPVYTRELAVPGTTIASFAPSEIVQAHGDSVRAIGAIVSDTPVKNQPYRMVWLRVENPENWMHRRVAWLMFSSDDLERTCTGIVAGSRPRINLTDTVLPEDALADDAVFRSTEEARRRMHNPPHLADARLISITKTKTGTIVRTTHDDGAVQWTAAFEYDTHGGLRKASYETSHSGER